MAKTKKLIADGGKQYTLTVTGTGWTTTRAIGIPYRTLDGAWRLRYNIVGVKAGTNSDSSFGLNVTGVTFKNLTNYHQSGSVIYYDIQGKVFYGLGSWAHPATNMLGVVWNNVTTHNGEWGISGDVELDSKPTWVP